MAPNDANLLCLVFQAIQLHDQTEAITLADRIALMQDGRIVQFDTPRELYNHPVDRFAGWFLGHPGMVFFDAPMHGIVGYHPLVSPLVPAPMALDAPGLTMDDGPICVGIRPELRSAVARRRAPSPPPCSVRPFRSAVSTCSRRGQTMNRRSNSRRS